MNLHNFYLRCFFSNLQKTIALILHRIHVDLRQEYNLHDNVQCILLKQELQRQMLSQDLF